MQSEISLTKSEQFVLKVFRTFRVTPGQMLCFSGPNLKKHKGTLEKLAERELLVVEEFKGGYSLTDAGFEAMKAYT